MRRIRELDGLRGLAALTVVFFHLYPTAVPFGWAAVDLFFVLSGFLITGIILDQGDQPHFMRAFYARRSLRIWPIYYLTLVILLITGSVSAGGCLPFALYLQNTSFYFMPLGALHGLIFDPDWLILNHTWSLAVEEQFYLIWPGLILFAGRRRVRTLSLFCLACSIVARQAGYPFTLLITRCDGLALGSLLAAVLDRREVTSHDAGRTALKPWLLSAYGVLTFLGLWLAWGWRVGRIRLPLSFRLDDPSAEVFTVSLLAFVVVAWVTVETGHRRLALLRWKPLCDLGTISYGIYLYHAPVLHCVQAILPRSTPGYRGFEGLFTLTTTLVLAIISWRYLEQPLLKLKHRFEYGGLPVAERQETARILSVPTPRVSGPL